MSIVCTFFCIQKRGYSKVVYETFLTSSVCFAGVTLTEANKTETWDPEIKAEEYPRTNKLVIRQALLGQEAKEGEFNVIQVLFLIFCIFFPDLYKDDDNLQLPNFI